MFLLVEKYLLSSYVTSKVISNFFSINKCNFTKKPNYPELNELTTGPTTRKTLIKTEEERVSTDAFYLTAPFNLERDDNSEVKLRVNHDIYSNNQNQ